MEEIKKQLIEQSRRLFSGDVLIREEFEQWLDYAFDMIATTLLTKTEKAEKLLKLTIEKQIRCGDGSGDISTHSVNCRCVDIDRQIEELKSPS